MLLYTIHGGVAVNLRRKGLTVVELLLVIAILAIMAAIAVPRYVDMAAQRELDAAAGQLAGDLQWSMKIAANSTASSIVKMMFNNTSPYGYYVVQGESNTLIRPLYNLPVTIVFPREQTAVIFDVYGKPFSGMDVVVTMLNTRGQSRVVTVDHLTGQVQIQ